jgi:hypothetical protein
VDPHHEYSMNVIEMDELKLLLSHHKFHFDIEIVRLDLEHDRLSHELEENLVQRRELIKTIRNLEEEIRSHVVDEDMIT